ncbi:4Fe-4S binding protein [Flavobacterium sp. H122]
MINRNFKSFHCSVFCPIGILQKILNEGQI